MAEEAKRRALQVAAARHVDDEIFAHMVNQTKADVRRDWKLAGRLAAVAIRRGDTFLALMRASMRLDDRFASLDEAAGISDEILEGLLEEEAALIQRERRRY